MFKIVRHYFDNISFINNVSIEDIIKGQPLAKIEGKKSWPANYSENEFSFNPVFKEYTAQLLHFTKSIIQ